MLFPTRNLYTQYFNPCISWNINGQNFEKHDRLIHYNLIFYFISICLQEIGNSLFFNSFLNFYSFLNHYRTELRCAGMKIRGIHAFILVSTIPTNLLK